MLKQRLYWILIFLVAFSCKKETDQAPPQISIESPASEMRYSVLEEVHVQAEITDNEQIESVTLSLISEQTGNKVLKSVFLNPGGSSYRLDQLYPLSDSLLPGGRYYFNIEANDGENRSNAFQYIRIDGIPKKRIGFLASCESNGVSKIYQVDDQSHIDLIRTYSNSFQAAVFNSYDQHFWFLPKDGNQFSVFNLNEGEEVFNQTINTAFPQLFNQMDLSERQVFISHKERELRGYAPSFGSSFLYQSASNRYVNTISAGSKYVMAEEFNLQGDERFIQVLFKVSGAPYVSIPMQHAVVALEFLDQDHGLAGQNVNGEIVLKELSFDNGSQQELISIPGEQVAQMIKVSDNIYYLVTDSKVIRYDYTSNNYFSVLSGQNNPVVCIDSLNQTLLVAEGNIVDEYDLLGNPLNTYTLAETVVGLTIRYNK